MSADITRYYWTNSTQSLKSINPIHKHNVLPPWDQGGNDFCVISQAGGATAKLQEPGWEHIQGGEDDSRQSSRGGLLYHGELLVFPQNVSP